MVKLICSLGKREYFSSNVTGRCFFGVNGEVVWWCRKRLTSPNAAPPRNQALLGDYLPLVSLNRGRLTSHEVSIHPSSDDETPSVTTGVHSVFALETMTSESAPMPANYVQSSKRCGNMFL